MTRHLPALTAALLLGLLTAAPCSAASKASFTIRGAGFGHGVGMSQYGALGFAEHGWTAPQILAHYYTGTALGTTDESRQIRVLLSTQTGAAQIAGATGAGAQALSPSTTYVVRRSGLSRLSLTTAAGKRVGSFTAPLQIAGAAGGVGFGGKRYRGILELTPLSAGGGIEVVNAVGLEDYLRGVVPAESPASWPAAALQAQAVAARTYAITTAHGGGFDVYPDTRSQVYGGIGAETPTTDAAVAATAGQVVTYDGSPVVTYFFSTSGGQTEDVENTSLGDAPEPWLKSVDDPYDGVSPRHRWPVRTLSLASAGSRLGRLVKGSFRGIRVLQRGASPRIVRAQVLGTRGTTTVSGDQLRTALGLWDTWASFTSVASSSTAAAGPTVAVNRSGGATASAATLAPAGVLRGRVQPGRRGATLTVQRRDGGHWVTAATTTLGAGGRYAVAAPSRGIYRVLAAGGVGPAVRVG